MIGDTVWVVIDPDGVALNEDAFTVHYKEPNELPEGTICVKRVILP